MSWTYTTPEKVKNLSGIGEQSLRADWCDWVEALIDNELGYSMLAQTTYTQEAHDGDNTPLLFVDHPPIVSVSALTVDDSTFTSSDYKVYHSWIKLITNTQTEISKALYADPIFPEGEQNVKITYIGGSSTVPKNIELCATQMVAAIALVAAREGSDASLKYSRVTRNDGDQSTTTESFGLQSALKNIMKTYLQKGLKIR